jgi:hypothetical protein
MAKKASNLVELLNKVIPPLAIVFYAICLAVLAYEFLRTIESKTSMGIHGIFILSTLFCLILNIRLYKSTSKLHKYSEYLIILLVYIVVMFLLFILLFLIVDGPMY